MSDEVETLRAEVAALRAQLDASNVRALEPRTAHVTRRRLLTGLAGLGAATAAGAATASPASADDGDALVLGSDNHADSTTTLTGSTSGEPVLSVEIDDGGTAANFYGGITSLGIVGVRGDGYIGVSGSSEEGFGVAAEGLDDALGLAVTSEHAAAISITTTNGPHVVFEPVGGVGPTDGHLPIAVGAVTVDANLDLWLCTAAGPPPTWTRLLREDTASGRIVPIAPVRALDTRATGGRPPGSPAVPGQKRGPLKGGETVTLDLAGAGPIPATATAVLGNLTVVGSSYTGYLAAGPHGATLTTSALNFTKGAVVANSFTSGLGVAGLATKASGTTANTYHLIVDVTAYVT